MIRRFTMTLILACTVLLSSCIRQELEEVLYTKALIPVLIDWESRALMYVDDDPDEDLYSASVWLYPTEDSEYQGEPLEYKLVDPEHEYIEVPVGIYDVLVFNKTVTDYSSSVGFRGTDNFDTFEYYVKPNTSASSLFSLNRADDDDSDLSHYPDLLAAWTMEGDEKLVITFNEITSYEKVSEVRSRTKSRTDTRVTADDFSELDPSLLQLINITPERLTHHVTVVETIENLHSLSYSQVTFKGVSSSVKLASKDYSSDNTSHIATLTSKQYTDVENKIGEVTGSFNVIGRLDESSSYSLDAIFYLSTEYNGSLIYPTPPADSFTFDVTDQVEGAILGLEKHFDLYVSVTLPYLVVPGDGGFDIDVDDWGDTTVIPMNE
ncbi:MAG: DUF5119 domain-containing protein [Rikenellaceae bacterium]